MQILPNTSIAVGIEWTLHESLAQAKKAVAGKKKVLVGRKIISGECVQGFCPAPAKTKKLQAGALLAAAVANDVLIYHSLGDGRAWVCAVREGIPLHGFDVVADEESAKVTLAEVMSYVPTADIYGDIPGAKGGLDDLFSHLGPKDRKNASLSVPESPLLIIVLIMVILLLAITAVFILPAMMKRLEGNRALMQSEEELRKARMAFEVKVEQERRVFWHAVSPTKQFALWYEVLRSLPVSVEGWTPSTLSCDPNACQVTWKRDVRALPSSIGNLPGSASAASFNPALTQTTTSFPLNKLEPVAHVSGAAKTDQYLLDLSVNTAQFVLVLNPSQTPITVAPPPGVQGLLPVTLGKEGGWRLTGSNPLLMPEFLGRIEQPGVTLNALSIKNLNLSRPPYTIELEGRYRAGN